MKVSIIEDYCIGCGLCKRLYPDIFNVENKCAYVKKRAFDGHEIKFIKDAKMQCPMSAIKIDE